MDGEEIAALVQQFLANPLQLVAAVEDLKERLPEANARKPGNAYLVEQMVAEMRQLVAAMRLIEKNRGDVIPWHTLPDLTISLDRIAGNAYWPGLLENTTRADYQAFENALETFRAAVLVNHRLQHPDAAAATPDASGDEVPPCFRDRSGYPIGPLTGTRTEIATAIRGVDTRPEQLQTMHRHGRIFVRKLGRTVVEVFFRSREDYEQAQSRMSKNHSGHNS